MFQASDVWRPWDIFSPPGFQHVWVFKQIYYPKPRLTANKYAIKFEWLTNGMHMDVWWAHPVDVAKYFLNEPQTTSILRYTVEKTPLLGYNPRGIMTCVSTVKPLLGLRAWWVMTPYQLWNHLIYNGAESMEV